MKTLSFPEISDFENGMPIPALTGKVKTVFDQRRGEGDYGPWALQSFILMDDHANELTCTWTGEDTVNDLKGKTVLIESTHNKKDMLVGIKKEIKNKNGKRYESVKLDERCKIKTLNHNEPTHEIVDTDKGKRIDPPNVQPAGAAEEPFPFDPPYRVDAQQAESGNGVEETRKHLMQSANLLVLCIRCAEKAVAPHQPPIAQTTEQFQADVAKLYIEASSRRTTDGIHWWSYIDRMPEKPLPVPVAKEKVSRHPINQESESEVRTEDWDT